MPSDSNSGGFDVVLGNPPWDTMSPDIKEFFSAFDTDVRFQDKAGQEAIVQSLLESPEVQEQWMNHQRSLYAAVHFIKSSGRYEMFAKGNLGKGDFNVYRMFVETALSHTRTDGCAAQLVPENLSNGPNAAAIREYLFDHTRLVQLLGFENTREIWFKDIDSRTKFCMYVARIGGKTTRFPAAFRIDSPVDLAPTESNRIQMDVSLIRELSPDALAVPELESQEAIDLSVKTYGRWPKFGDTEKWKPVREYMREIDMGNDRHLFNSEGVGVPVYEGRMVGQFDHRAKGYVSGRGRSAVWEDFAFDGSQKRIQPQWWIDSDKLPRKVLGRVSRYRIGFCDVASPTNERSLVATILPPHSVSGHSVPTITLDDAEPWQYVLWVAVANAYAVDYLVRRKVSLHLNYSILDSIPIPNPPLDAPGVRRCIELAARLVCCGEEMQPLWERLCESGWVSADDSCFETEESRLVARAQIDAIIARDILGLSAQEMRFVLEDFPTAAKYEVARWGTFRSRDLILSHFGPPRARIDQGKQIAYILALLDAWKKPVSKPLLERGLVLMLNDAARRTILDKTVTVAQSDSLGAIGDFVRGITSLYDYLVSAGMASLAGQTGLAITTVGTSKLGGLPQDDRDRAAEVIAAAQRLGDEERFIAAVGEVTNERYELVST
jgi:hypothetical protein